MEALLLSLWKIGHIHPSREYTKAQGISQNRWQNAITLLKMARVVTRHRHWTTKDLDLIETRLKSAVQTALDHPEAFFLRHPRHRV